MTDLFSTAPNQFGAPAAFPPPAVAAPRAAACDSSPPLLEYTPPASSTPWRVERFAEFAAEFELRPQWAVWPERMAKVHALLSGYTRQWTLVRRLYGIYPVIPPAHAGLDDLRAHTVEEVCAALAIDRKQLRAELDAVRSLLGNVVPAAAPVVASAPAAPPKTELEFGHECLAEFGFSEKQFLLAERTAEENRAERDWFAGRVREWVKMLREPMSRRLAVETLLNELYLRRLQTEQMQYLPSSPKFKELAVQKRQTETQFLEQVEKLEKMFPELGGVAGRTHFTATVGGVTGALMEYYGQGNGVALDQVFKTLELPSLMRQSVQNPEPLYRYGLSFYIAEALRNLWNPHWRSRSPLWVLKRMDAIGKEVINQLREHANIPLTDLVKDGPEGEYQDLDALDALDLAADAAATGTAATAANPTPTLPAPAL